MAVAEVVQGEIAGGGEGEHVSRPIFLGVGVESGSKDFVTHWRRQEGEKSQPNGSSGLLVQPSDFQMKHCIPEPARAALRAVSNFSIAESESDQSCVAEQAW